MLLSKKCIKIISLMLCFAVLSCFIGKAYSQTSKPEINAGLRSLLFPGLGQKYNKEDKKSLIFMIAGGALLATTGYMIYNQSAMYNDYKSAADAFNGNKSQATWDTADSKYSEYGSSLRTANIVIGITSAFWAYNIYDAYAGGRRRTIVKKVDQDEKAADTVKCGNCGTDFPADFQFCPKCGTKKVEKDAEAEQVRKCSNCQADVPIDFQFCPKCGTKFEASTETNTEIEVPIDETEEINDAAEEVEEPAEIDDIEKAMESELDQ